MRASLLISALLALLALPITACAVDPTSSESPPATRRISDRAGAPTSAEVTSFGPDLCALAAALPDGDICRLMCDPEAMEVQLVSEGSRAGTCYEFRCVLPDGPTVSVGVCLPP